MTKGPKITVSELAAAMDKALDLAMGGKVMRERPAGYFTASEYSEHHGLPTGTAANHLRRLVRDGKAKSVLALALSKDGRAKITSFYVLDSK